MNFEEQLQYYTQLVNRELDNLLKVSKSIYSKVEEAIKYSVIAGGKRLRPVLTLSVCKALGGNEAVALPFACAVECIHASSLIHDDMPCMDDDDIRRGKPSCHIAFGEDLALLAGDGLILKAFEILASAVSYGATPKMVADATSILSSLSGVDGMVGGQTIDLCFEGNMDPMSLEQMHLLKTGALIQAACQIGGVAAGADEHTQLSLKRYAQSLGLAFQICDDLLDVEGDEAALGKPVGSDACKQKTTYVSLYGLEQARELARMHTVQAERELEHFEDSSFLLQLTRYLLKRER